MRLLFMAIHNPKPEHIDDLVGAMTRFGGVLASTDGVLHASAWRADEQIVAISIWDSRDRFVAAGPALAAAIADVPFAAWEARPRELLMLEEVATVGSLGPFGAS
jgi:hypothetical protein